MTVTEQRNTLMQAKLEAHLALHGFARCMTMCREPFYKKGDTIVIFTKCAYRIQEMDTSRAFTQASIEAMAKKGTKVAGTYYKDVVINDRIASLPDKVASVIYD